MYTFTKHPDPTNLFDQTTVSVSLEAVALRDLLDAFTEFLRGCGFVLDGLELKEPEE